MTDSFIGRQAIYDTKLGIHGYELLYRDGPLASCAEFVDGDRATATVVTNALLDLGAQRLAGDAFCFINLTEGFITGRLPLPLPVDRVVIEVLEDIVLTPELLRGLKELKARGARIALDDYVERPDENELLAISDYVKVDILGQSPEEIATTVARLKTHGVKLLAEKVETAEEMKLCEELGFEYFQGFFLTEPEVLTSRSVPASRVSLLRTLQRLLDPDVGFDDLVRLIGQDPALSFKLLRYANSTRFAPENEIASLSQVVVMLGIKTVRKIVSLMILVALDNKPGNLLELTIVRARMCELIGQSCSELDPATFYTLGLLSTLDALTGTEMNQALEHMPLSQSLKDALLDGRGELGSVLACVRAFERAEWEHVSYGNLQPSTITEMYVQAVDYSNELWGGVPSGSDAA